MKKNNNNNKIILLRRWVSTVMMMRVIRKNLRRIMNVVCEYYLRMIAERVPAKPA